VEKLAAEKHCKPSQFASPGCCRAAASSHSAQAAQLSRKRGRIAVRLTTADIDRLEKVVPKGIAAGERYPQQGMQTVNI
jgi:hypothetical protein